VRHGLTATRPTGDLVVFAENRFRQKFAAAYGSVPLQIGQKSRRRPSLSTWARFFVRTGKTFILPERSCLIVRTPGFFEFQVFVPEGKGGDVGASAMVVTASRMFGSGNLETSQGYLRVTMIVGPIDLGVRQGVGRHASRILFEYDFPVLA
jgi:hypothetical protein